MENYMPQFTKDQIAVLLANPIYVEQAIRLLGANQTRLEYFEISMSNVADSLVRTRKK